MLQLTPRRFVDDQLRSQVSELVGEVEERTGVRFLSDHLWLDLHQGPSGERSDWAAVSVDREDGRLAVYAQASAANEGIVVESAAHPDLTDGDLEQQALAMLFDSLAEGVEAPLPVTWWVHDVADHHEQLAADLGLSQVRDLYQMRRRLPTGEAVTVDTRSFDAARDAEAWVRVNNRAFATHGEQGGWNVETLHLRMGEPWFDADGFRIHERDGRLAAFCWTKLHPATPTDPELGEIYVIGVDPDFQRLGLGRQLTLAGLESIHERGVSTAMLFVDAANTAAVEMYRVLGFDVHRTDRAYSMTVGPI